MTKVPDFVTQHSVMVAILWRAVFVLPHAAFQREVRRIERAALVKNDDAMAALGRIPATLARERGRSFYPRLTLMTRRHESDQSVLRRDSAGDELRCGKLGGFHCTRWLTTRRLNGRRFEIEGASTRGPGRHERTRAAGAAS